MTAPLAEAGGAVFFVWFKPPSLHHGVAASEGLQLGFRLSPELLVGFRLRMEWSVPQRLAYGLPCLEEAEGIGAEVSGAELLVDIIHCLR